MKPDDKKIWNIGLNEDRWRKRKKRSEDFQTVDAVIDLNTAKHLKRLQNKGFIDSITGTIASGKESGVFLAELGPKGREYCKAYSIKSPIVVKIFRTSTLNFKQIVRYIYGDRRFQKYSKNIRHIINLWVEKEYSNLQRSSLAQINVPKPILAKNNILLMELLGKDGKPYPLLKFTPKAFVKATLTQILNQTKLLFQRAGLVHADLSPFNIIMVNQTPYFIDMSQSVLISHPRALEFLKRDLRNVLSSFKLKGLSVPNEKELFDEITIDFPDKDLIL
ncbi:MAG: serine protein kinase RIO [Candidatus Heimdallarchaeota archaeon]|nr:MAG: serine protein kinase RIO [Candidatus Heimdallarchaeota archaeon]